MQTISQESFLSTATNCLDWELSVIPMYHKHPSNGLKWKPFQIRRMTKDELRDVLIGATGLAIIPGKISRGLAIIDFDDIRLYNEWAEKNRALASKLPTVRTARGIHVYVRLPSPHYKKMQGGELIGNSKHYCLIPNSLHPSGCHYTWLAALYHPDKIPILSFSDLNLPVSMLVPSVSVSGPNTNTLSVVTLGGLQVAESTLIQGYLPTKWGERRQKLFEFSRALKSVGENGNKDVDEMCEIVKEWHKRSLPFIKTKRWESTWKDFVGLWEYAIPHLNIVKRMRLVIRSQKPPRSCLHLHRSAQKIAMIFRELQLNAGNQPVFIGQIKLGEICRFSHVTAGKWIKKLIKEDLLELVTKGTFQSRKFLEKYDDASTYYWRGGV